MRKIGNIQGSDIFLQDDGSIMWIAGMMIDSDGGNNPDHDPYWQRATSLSFRDKPLDAESVPYIVVPPLIIKAAKHIVLGCRATVTHLLNKKFAMAVVGDVGPHLKIGEGSVALAKLLGVNSNAVHGGEDRPILRYQIWPGFAALVDGKQFELKPSIYK